MSGVQFKYTHIGKWRRGISVSSSLKSIMRWTGDERWASYLGSCSLLYQMRGRIERVWLITAQKQETRPPFERLWASCSTAGNKPLNKTCSGPLGAATDSTLRAGGQRKGKKWSELESAYASDAANAACAEILPFLAYLYSWTRTQTIRSNSQH